MQIRSVVRGGGVGASAWVARITGPDPKYGLKREFVRADRSGLSRSGKSGVVVFTLDAPGYFEYRDVMRSAEQQSISDGTDSGFVQLTVAGELIEVTRADVLAAFSQPVAAGQ